MKKFIGELAGFLLIAMFAGFLAIGIVTTIVVLAIKITN